MEVLTDGDSEERTFLEVREATHSDWGVYTCRATNTIANNEAAVVLKGNKDVVLVMVMSFD